MKTTIGPVAALAQQIKSTKKADAVLGSPKPLTLTGRHRLTVDLDPDVF